MQKENIMLKKCQICNSDFKEVIEASDKMFEASEKFFYGLCEKCGCLQELNPPKQMHEHYPKNYYSLKKISKPTFKNWRRGLKRRLILTHPKAITKLIKFLINGNEVYWTYRDCGLKIEHKFLDVGTGSGEHVIELRQSGLSGAIGIDPHIEEEITYENTILVKKCDLQSVNEKYDFIAFHHSLEHIPDQIGTIQAAQRLLNDNGKIIIRIPTVSSIAYEKYKSNWFQLDAPRHLFLHSHQSIENLANTANMKITKMWCDSNENQFLISELHQKNVKTELNHDKIKIAIKHNFTKEELMKYKQLTRSVNAELKGDQIFIVLEKYKN